MTRTYRQNMYLVRTNIVGDTIWTTNPGLYWQPETAFGVAESVDGSIFVAGQGIAGHGGDMYWSAQVHKYQSNGTFMWYHDYGELYADDIAYDIIEATVNNQHGFVIAGTTNSVDIAGWDAPDAFLIRFNANGGVVWTRAYHRGGSLDDSGFGSVVRTIDGGFFCAGYASDWLSPNLEQGFIVKTDSLGNALWSRTWGGGCCHYYSAGRQSSDTSFWCVGAFLDDGNYNSMLHHWSNTGDYIGATVLGGLFDDNLFDLIQTPDGSFIVTGYTQLEDQTADLYLAKIDAAGSVVWEHTYGGEQIEVGTAIERLSDGTYLLAGYTTSFGAGDKDMWLLRVNPDNVLPAGEPSYPLPRSTQLRVFPNPFNSVTTLFVELSEPEPIRLQVYDINGRLVRQIVEQTALPPNYVARFDGTELPSGSYYLYLTTPQETVVKRCILLR
ncbi:T9SS type A sorting domain-containing protein [bacterium]|nr:T9SS type A sorting domain-containing protein [bacterium]